MNIAREILFLFAAVAGLAVQATAQTAPVITAQPTNQIVVAGTNASFSIAVSGSGPFTYQWQFNGTNLPTTVIKTAAGGATNTFSGDGGPATGAGLYGPTDIAVDGVGNIFIADAGNQRVRKVGTNGIIETLAGNGTTGFSGDGGPATNASLNDPVELATDGAGNLFIADLWNYRIRMVAPNGTITTLAGGGNGGDGSVGTNAAVITPYGVATDSSRRIFFSETFAQRIRRVDAAGIVTTVAGNAMQGYSGDGGPATNASFFNPGELAVDGSGNIFVADYANHRIRKVGTDGIITTVAGTGVQGFSGDGGAATNASLYYPAGVAFDGRGNFFIADSSNQRIRKVDTNGIITTVVGNGTEGYSGDGGDPTNASLDGPNAVAISPSGDLLIADYLNQRIRRVFIQGPTLTLDNVGTNEAGNYAVVVSSPYGSVTSSVTTLTVLLPPVIYRQPKSEAAVLGGIASFDVLASGTVPLDYQWYFNGIAVAGQTNETLVLTNVSIASGGVYEVIVSNAAGSITSGGAVLATGTAPTVTDQPTNLITIAGAAASFGVGVSGSGPFTYQWRLNGTNLPDIITTVSGGGTAFPGIGGPATNALGGGGAVALDSQGNLYITCGELIGRVGADGILRNVAGDGEVGYSGDGGPATNANLTFPEGLAVDGTGNLFIADNYNNCIRKVTTDGIISTVAGKGTSGYSGDGGQATNALLSYPKSVAVDGSGNLFIADSQNNLVRRVGPDGIIRTAAGVGYSGYSGDGGPAIEAALYPSGVALDARGNLFIADFYANVVRMVGTNGVITTVAGTGTPGFSGDGSAATNALLSGPQGVSVDALENLFIADQGNNRIREVTTDGIITTIAGSGTQGYSGDGGAATSAALYSPTGMALDRVGNVFIADTYNGRVRKVSAQGPVLTLNSVGPGDLGSYDVAITNPFGSVTSRAVVLTVALPPLYPAIDGVGRFVVQLTSIPGQTYTLQTATSLHPPINWQPVFTNAADANGNWSFTNSNLSASPALFYRVTVP